MSKVDFGRVPEHLHWVHGRLVNWARWVIPATGVQVSPTFREYRSHAWQWHPKEFREPCDILEAQEVERIVRGLSPAQREAVRWWYVRGGPPYKQCRRMGITALTLQTLVNQGRAAVEGAMAGRRAA